MVAKRILFLFFLVSSLQGIAQTPGIVWSKTFGGSATESGRIILAVDGGQNFLVIGDTTQFTGNVATDNSDLWLQKINGDGEKIWSKKIGGSGDDRVRKAYVHADGSFTVIGWTTSNDGDVSGNHGGGDIWVVKISNDGNLLWQKCLGGSLPEDYRDDELLPDNSLIIAGYTTSNDGDVTGYHSGNDFWIVKLTASGSVEWQKCLGGSNDDRPRSVISLPGGGYIVTGFSNSSNGDISGNHGNYDLWVVKLDITGNVVWKKLYGGTIDESGYKSIIANNGSIIVLSETTSTNGDISGNHGGRDIWVLGLDSSNGSILWQRCIGGSSYENPKNMVKDLDGNFFLASQTFSTNGDAAGSDGKEILINKINEAGSLIFSKCIGGAVVEDLFTYISPFHGLVNTYRTNILLDSADNSYLLIAYVTSNGGDVSGYHYSRPSPNSLPDAWIVKIENNGNLLWQKCIGGSSTDYLVDVQKSSNNEFVFLGYTASSNGDIETNKGATDLWVMKLGPVSRIYTSQFFDSNLNGIKDIDEPYSDFVVQTDKSGKIKRNVPVNGQLIFEVDTGLYVTRLILQNSYYTVSPAADTSVFTGYFQSDSVTFRLTPLPGKRDININIVPLSVVRPGFPLSYELVAKNLGTDTVSAGQVILKKDGRMDFVSAVPAPDEITGDTLKWNYSNFKPFDTIRIYVNMQTQPPPILNINDTVTSLAWITPVDLDLTPGDDTAILRQRLQGSYDPNDKSENHAGSITQQEITNGAYINYMIRFQNNGTDTAFTITVRDTLDAKLDWSSLEMIDASHPCLVHVNAQNIITWTFTDVRLVDSLHNAIASKGFIAFRIKPQSYLGNGDIVANSASIYFDFNLPVKTNAALIVVKGNDFRVCPQSGTTIPLSIPGDSFQWQVDEGSGYVNLGDNSNYLGSTNDTLQLVSIPASWYGFKYRCLIAGQNGISYSPVYTLRIQAKWNGQISNAWEDPGNWDCGNLPDLNSDVVISDGAVRVNSNVTVRSLIIRPGASLIVDPGNTLTVLH